MTPGNNGASTPEDDDPFGYLYADGQAAGAQPPSGGYGYPNSVNRVRAVGERQYGQQQSAYGQQQPGYGQQAPTGQYGQPQSGYGQQTTQQHGRPNAHYAAPETMPGGAQTSRQASVGAGGGGRGRGPNTKGLLIGAIAVVAAVVIGIAVAMSGGDTGDDKNDDAAGSSPSASQSAEPSQSATKEAESAADLPEVEAKALRLEGGATTASEVEGAGSDGGVYVAGLNQTGASVTWSVDGIPKDGVYTLFAGYSVAGDDGEMTLTVNGKTFGSKLNLGNFTGADDFAKGWTQTYAYPSLSKGSNTITISCQDGDSCDVLLDRLWLKEGQVKK
ncbi:carbohydrate-binding protein [Streptomyces sp. NPDC059785]|uniref:carbohydrate-binding protein n=1 Tax=unclassified Streptomyces TaxID=2593676 RepID=UPI00366902AF